RSMSTKNNAAWKRWAPDWKTVLSGVLVVLAVPPLSFWPLLWVCLIPWFMAIQRSPRPRDAFIQGYWLCYIVGFGSFFWVAFVLKEFGNLPWILSILGLQVFCLFGQPQFFIFAPLFKMVQLGQN